MSRRHPYTADAAGASSDPFHDSLGVLVPTRRAEIGLAVTALRPGDVQVGQDMSCDAVRASISAHATPQASVEPAPPPHVLSKAMYIALSLIKPTSTHAEATQTLLGWPKLAAWMESIAEKIKPCRCAPDESFHSVQT